MQYRGQEFQYADGMDLETEAVEKKSSGKEYRRAKRPQRSSRRKSSSSANHPGYGISGRRNHRWSW